MCQVFAPCSIPSKWFIKKQKCPGDGLPGHFLEAIEHTLVIRWQRSTRQSFCQVPIMFAHPRRGDGNFSERKRQVFQLPVPSWATAECSKDLILWLVLAPFLWEKYYTRKEVTCEYNILVDILYVWKDEDSWTQVESDIQILALPGKEMRWYLHILFRRLREWCRYGIKKIQPRALSCIFFSWLSLRITQLSNDDRIQHELSRVLLPLRITQLSNDPAAAYWGEKFYYH